MNQLNNQLAQIKHRCNETLQEWSTSAYKNGTEAEKLLHEFALLGKERNSNCELMENADEGLFIALEQKNKEIMKRMTEIEIEYSTQLDIDDGLIFK